MAEGKKDRARTLSVEDSQRFHLLRNNEIRHEYFDIKICFLILCFFLLLRII